MILSGFFLLAQGKGTVTGTIVDAETGNPMVAVNITADRHSCTISKDPATTLQF